MKTLLRPLNFIFSHPLTSKRKVTSLIRFFKWQIKSRVKNTCHTMEWFSGLKLNVVKGMYGATGCIYVGLPEFEDMSFVLHFLRKDDIFIDIGANVGVYSLLANGVCKTKTFTFEPVPSTYNFLQKNIALNKLINIECFNLGLADQNGELFFSSDSDTNNHVVFNKVNNSVKVSVQTLDSIVENKINTETFIKLDVEGFEIKVLKGSKKILQNDYLIGLIVELNGCSRKFGFTDESVDIELTKYGFFKYEYNPFLRELIEINDYHTEKNTLYLKKSKIDLIQSRLKKAKPFKIYNYNI